MSDLRNAFNTAIENSKNVNERPDNATLLKLYALYKQASIGDNTENKPSFSDMVARAKWDAWITLKGVPAEVAMKDYINLVDTLN
jgi:diazepam-binding inhibitor (GABA receptor modulating acyl-CoA-binding protein)